MVLWEPAEHVAQSQPPEVEEAVHHALQVGYRHIDMAAIYLNEAEVGKGLNRWLDAGGKREDVFLTSKVHRGCLPADPDARCSGTQCTCRRTSRGHSTRLSPTCASTTWTCVFPAASHLTRPAVSDPLGASSLRDRRLTRQPVSLVPSGEKDSSGNPKREDVPLEETWGAMEELLASGRVKHIGLSNYRQDQIEATMKVAKHTPDVLQIERASVLRLMTLTR